MCLTPRPVKVFFIASDVVVVPHFDMRGTLSTDQDCRIVVVDFGSIANRFDFPDKVSREVAVLRFAP